MNEYGDIPDLESKIAEMKKRNLEVGDMVQNIHTLQIDTIQKVIEINQDGQATKKYYLDSNFGWSEDVLKLHWVYLGR